MIRNCTTFNPAGNPVHQAGVELQQLFEEKWRNLPPLRSVISEDEDEDEDEDSEDERHSKLSLYLHRISLILVHRDNSDDGIADRNDEGELGCSEKSI